MSGDLPPARPDQSYDPPAGGQAVAGERGVIRAKIVIIIAGGGGGLFVYSPTIALGNLVASIAAQSGTDHVGNEYIGPGMFTYVNNFTTWVATGIRNGTLQFFTAPGPGGAWTAQAVINAASVNLGDVSIEAGFVGNVNLGAGSGGNVISQSPTVINSSGPGPGLQINVSQNPSALQINNALASPTQALAQLIAAAVGDLTFAVHVAGDSNSRLRITSDGNISWGSGAASPDTTLERGAAGGLVIPALGLNLTGGLVADAVTAGGASGTAITASNTGAASPTVLLVQAAAANAILRGNVTGDTNARYRLDADGGIFWGTGAASPDTLLYRGGVAQLAASGIVQNKSGNPETWQVPTFANSWSNFPGRAPLQYRLVPAPYNSMQWTGNLIAPAGIAAGQAIITAVPAAYRPNNPTSVMATDVSSGGIVRLQMGTGGVLLYESGAIAGDTIEISDQLVSLDA